MSRGSVVATRPLVVLEGCGLLVNEYLWRPAFKSHVEEGRITLCVTDVQPTAPASSIRDYLAQGGQNLTYVDKGSENGRATLALCEPACIYVATTDDTHCDVAGTWLLPSARAGLVVVEKPFAPCAEDIRRLREKLGRTHCDHVLSRVRQIDNYRIRALPARKHMVEVVARVGTVARVEARVTEARLVELNRDLPGMILDLLPHALAALRVIGRVEIDDAQWARYPGAYMTRGLESAGVISGRIELDAMPGKPCPLTIVVGKGVGSRDEKHIELVSDSGHRAARISFIKEDSAITIGVLRGGTYHPDILVAPLGYRAHSYFVQCLVEWLHGTRGIADIHELLCAFDQAEEMAAQIDKAYRRAGRKRLREYPIGGDPRKAT